MSDEHVSALPDYLIEEGAQYAELESTGDVLRVVVPSPSSTGQREEIPFRAERVQRDGHSDVGMLDLDGWNRADAAISCTSSVREQPLPTSPDLDTDSSKSKLPSLA
jgi:hypothetical protein